MEKIKQLREKTGAGIVDCKKALLEAGDDIDKACEILRKKGIAKAAKRGERETKEGIIKISLNDDKTKGYIAKFNSETDFVAKNEKFQKFTEEIFNIIKNNNPENLEALMQTQMADGNSVKDNLESLSGVIGEKLEIEKFEILSSAGTVNAYSHMGGKIGALVALDKSGMDDLAYDIAMQIAAVNPKYISRENVPQEIIEKEKEIYREQLLKEGKPENIIDKIMEGKLNKFYEEVCLVDQEFIKDEKKKIRDILGEVKVEKFIRYSF